MPVFDSFTWSTFIDSLSAINVLLALVLGLFMGWAISKVSHSTYATTNYLYWQVTSIFVFFLPMALLRNLEGSMTWERFAATGVLWTVFVFGKYCGSMLHAWFTRKEKRRG